MKIMQMEECKGCTIAAMETTPAEAVDSPLMASGISTAASASMSSCALKKSGMNQEDKLQRVTVEVIERFL